MNPLDQRIAIAESIGIVRRGGGPQGIYYQDRNGDGDNYYLPEIAAPYDAGDGCLYLPFPNYLTDLNAMHEVEKMLPPALQGAYAAELFHTISEYITNSPDFTEVYTTITATAAQRAEAYLRTIGKWKD